MTAWTRFGRNGLAAALALQSAATFAGCQFDARATQYTDSGIIPPDGGNDGPPDAPPDAPSDGPVAVAPQDCPSAYVALEGAPITSKYRIVDGGNDWPDARKKCAQDADDGAVARTHLVALETHGEYQVIASQLGGNEQQLGLMLPNDSATWAWVTGAQANAELIPWALNEPTWGYFCTFIEQIGFVNDEARVRTTHCQSSQRRQYICECEDGLGDQLYAQ